MIPPYPPSVTPPASRFVKRGAYLVCLSCDMAAQYCACSRRPPADPGSTDMADESSLKDRIAEVVAQRGTSR